MNTNGRMQTTKSRGGRVAAVIGGQYGSEGKGVIVNYMASHYEVHIRTGGPNAGHSFYHGEDLYKMQMLPCGWTNPAATLVIGPGAVVDLRQLSREVEQVQQRTGQVIWDRLVISEKAAVIDKRHHAEEGGVEGELHRRIGSTGEGVGSARTARMARDVTRISLAGECYREFNIPEYCIYADVPKILQEARTSGANILLEGTQGSGLSLVHGPWPYTTSADTNAGQFAADAGIPPHKLTDVLLVIRSHPIRVAGNSGPLRNEISWEDLSRELGREVIERTTVTQKVRRVGLWDEDLVDQAVTLNAPTAFALTFADYIDPGDEGKTRYVDLGTKTRSFVDYLESRWNIPVAFVGTGGPRWNVIDRGIMTHGV
jgi:adenylosuccinate synthase